MAIGSTIPSNKRHTFTNKHTKRSRMEFLDCNLAYGLADIVGGQVKGCASFAELKTHMDRAGLAGGLVIQSLSEVKLGNELLAADIRGHENIHGVWRLVPSCTGELPSPDALPAVMKANRIAALTLCPQINRFMTNKFAIGDYLDMAEARKIPVLLNTARSLSLEQAADIMTDFPHLTAVLSYLHCFPSDRQLRPFLDAFPNLHLDMTSILADSWLPDILKKYSATRILFGSGFPASYIGSHMMVIRHAQIADDDKRLIAGGNLRRLISEIRYD